MTNNGCITNYFHSLLLPYKTSTCCLWSVCTQRGLKGYISVFERPALQCTCHNLTTPCNTVLCTEFHTVLIITSLLYLLTHLFSHRGILPTNQKLSVGSAIRIHLCISFFAASTLIFEDTAKIWSTLTKLHHVSLCTPHTHS